jgi:broad specificity phosphatase PhoE
MGLIYLIRHPHTQVDFSTPVDTWELSETGQAQLADLVEAPIWPHVTTIYPSRERKAIVPAKEIALHYQLNVMPRSAFGEVNRSAYHAPDRARYEAAVKALFDNPNDSPHGWECADDAFQRFQREIDRIQEWHPANENIAIVAHGIVLTLYTAHLAGETPTLDRWLALGFGEIGAVDRDTMQQIGGFEAAPYAGIPLP